MAQLVAGAKAWRTVAIAMVACTGAVVCTGTADAIVRSTGSARVASRQPAVVKTTAAASPSPAPSSGTPVDDSITTVTPTPAQSPSLYTRPLNRLLLSASHGWVDAADMSLSMSALRRRFHESAATRQALTALGYRDGLMRTLVRPSPRVVVVEQLWRFSTQDAADGWLLVSAAGEKNVRSAADGSKIYLGPSRDEHGFSYGYGLARVANVVIVIRYSSLAHVTTATVRGKLSQAVARAEATSGVARSSN